MIEQYTKKTCEGCYGVGIQTNKDGIRVICPVCGGIGIRWISNLLQLPPGVYCNSTLDFKDISSG